MGLRAAPTPVFAVPDEETWLQWGRDLRARGLRPLMDPGRAEVLLAAEQVPAELHGAIAEAWSQMPRRRLEALASPLRGVSVNEVLHAAEGGHERHGGHQGHGGGGNHGGHHGDGGHGDMMGITGDPSADGLVMEPMDVEAGPLGVALPTGLLISASLDGDVVASCHVRQGLRISHSALDPTTTAAWSVAERTAAERVAGTQASTSEQWLRLAGVELERAVSHLAWLHRLTRLLGWRDATDRVHELLQRVAPGRVASAASRSPDLQEAAQVCATLADMLEGSRAFRRRTAGLGLLTTYDVQARGLAGPIARAAGVTADARIDDPHYRALGFQSLTRTGGDAHARAVLRTAEASQSLGLVLGALRLDRPDDEELPTPMRSARVHGAVVEGPRGPLEVVPVTGDMQVERITRGAAAALEAAAGAAVGREWAAALVAIASFDLSPWKVGR